MRRRLLINALFVLFSTHIYAQDIHSINGSNSDSCNVVNVHFGNSFGHDKVSPCTKSETVEKHGPIGPQGPKGPKGEKGDGHGAVDLNLLKKDVLVVLSARSCSELRDDHGISTTGYYWMRSNVSSNGGTYIYCDFRVYYGVSSCGELYAKYNTSIYGYYLLGNSTARFQYCPDIHTCHHLVQRDGITDSGFYQVGSPGDEYTVYCNLFSDKAITEVWHDSMEKKKASACEPAACYSLRPKYFIPMDKMLKITKHSRQCQQFIEFTCLSAVLLHGLNPIHGYWVSNDGERMKYWGGASSKRPGYCACGETGTCVDKNRKCNCDTNSGPMTSDKGYLTDKMKLPVSELRLGDMGDASESGWHTLGKLECIGPG